ncbi:hypothetical protein M413DRAFT_443750 [Hebeloma cylindrosporum]|uniref:Uncharacterized protein n=1 Tax=Hebeloma cylindrosporum TaxID=76867 RepID=A0A0C2Y1Y6_HEBCY|nr:hypothetical protein M413DRAFT_443750 [Hebeloma cylindrosporum h7]
MRDFKGFGTFLAVRGEKLIICLAFSAPLQAAPTKCHNSLSIPSTTPVLRAYSYSLDCHSGMQPFSCMRTSGRLAK